MLAAGEAAVEVEAVRGTTLVLLRQLGGQHGLLALAACSLGALRQGLREAEHEERGEEEEEAAEDEASPPGANPARVVGGDVHRACEQMPTHR